MLIPGQAMMGLSVIEGVETTEMSPNNNFPHERPITGVDKISLLCQDKVMNIKWDKEKDLFLETHYVLKGVKWCSLQLNISPGAVAHRACKIGLGKMKGETLKLTILKGYPCVSMGSYREQLHRLVAEYVLGRKLLVDEIVHHVDGNIWNVNPDNLQIVSRSEHQRIHWGENCDGRRNEKTGQFTSVNDIVRTHKKL